ncbi:MAG: prolipoprotein diacylglyceryl transferase [Alphaproteobacteria bacterium]|nr:MAG: prolipoprotein diacylglyceryl transferase [Alphaproteobacteria bacterium]
MTYIHNISPIAFSLGAFDVRWYGISYVIGFAYTWYGVRVKILQLYKHVSPRFVDDLVSSVGVGVLLGGRLGYVLFYDLHMLCEPWRILQIWNGGMSFHGALIGGALASIYGCRRMQIPILPFLDMIVFHAPLGIFLGRIANFINSEHIGRPTDKSWGVVFPTVDGVLRHPSQLYEAFLEGACLFLIVRMVDAYSSACVRGRILGYFLIFYGVFRCISEVFRTPDGYFLGITLGQLLSLPLLVIGLFLVFTRSSYSHNLTA